MPINSEESEAQSEIDLGARFCIWASQPSALDTLNGLCLAGQAPGNFARSYLLKWQVPLLKVQMEEVAYEGQAQGPRRVVLWAPTFEDVSNEEKGDGTQQESSGTERGPENLCQEAHRSEHGWDVRLLFRGLSQPVSSMGLWLWAASTAHLHISARGQSSGHAPGAPDSLLCLVHQSGQDSSQDPPPATPALCSNKFPPPLGPTQTAVCHIPDSCENWQESWKRPVLEHFH